MDPKCAPMMNGLNVGFENFLMTDINSYGDCPKTYKPQEQRKGFKK